MKKNDLVCFLNNGVRRCGTFVKKENSVIVVRTFSGLFYVNSEQVVS